MFEKSVFLHIISLQWNVGYTLNLISGRATWLGESKCINPIKFVVGFDRLSSISSEKSLRFSYLTKVNYQSVGKKRNNTRAHS